MALLSKIHSQIIGVDCIPPWLLGFSVAPCDVSGEIGGALSCVDHALTCVESV